MVKNAGFVAYGIAGSYDCLAIVDQTHLPNAIKDRVTKVVLGHTHEVRMHTANAKQEFVVATLFVCTLPTL